VLQRLLPLVTPPQWCWHHGRLRQRGRKL